MPNKTTTTTTEIIHDEAGRVIKEIKTVVETETPSPYSPWTGVTRPNAWWHPSMGGQPFINNELASVHDITSKIADAATAKAVKGVSEGGYL